MGFLGHYHVVFSRIFLQVGDEGCALSTCKTVLKCTMYTIIIKNFPTCGKRIPYASFILKNEFLFSFEGFLHNLWSRITGGSKPSGNRKNAKKTVPVFPEKLIETFIVSRVCNFGAHHTNDLVHLKSLLLLHSFLKLLYFNEVRFSF